MNGLSFELRYIFKNVDELRESQVTNLLAPSSLHPFHIEVFKEEKVKPVGQVMRKLKKEVPAFLRNRSVQFCQSYLCLLAMI